jgi:hypothetical protein
MSLVLAYNVAFGQVASATTAGGVTLLAARPGRRRVIFKNIDSSITVYIGGAGDTVSSSNSMVLLAGESIAIESNAGFKSLSASGTPSIAYIEEY